ncbi:hypothetical protein BV20DRAFT_779878 [Pilatotrama ljubarskyi]|nr:hypothetical protein BV20DRAFT_779878 [Pilatotrama ljubarskyi]
MSYAYVHPGMVKICPFVNRCRRLYSYTLPHSAYSGVTIVSPSAVSPLATPLLFDRPSDHPAYEYGGRERLYPPFLSSVCESLLPRTEHLRVLRALRQVRSQSMIMRHRAGSQRTSRSLVSGTLVASRHASTPLGPPDRLTWRVCSPSSVRSSSSGIGGTERRGSDAMQCTISNTDPGGQV